MENISLSSRTVTLSIVVLMMLLGPDVLRAEDPPEPEDLILFVGAEAAPLELSVHAGGSFTGFVQPITVQYWGDGEAIALLQEIAWQFDIDDSQLRSLPFGIAPLSSLTAPPATLGAAAMLMTETGALILLADQSGLLGVRTAQAVETDAATRIEEYSGIDPEVGVGCTASAGECSCNASGSQAHCRAWHEASTGTDWAECKDSEGHVRCWAKGGACACNPYVPAP